MIDSYACWGESLDKLAKNLYGKNGNPMNFHFIKNFSWITYGALMPKWILSIWMGRWQCSKLDYDGNPPMEAFHSQFKHESVLYDDDDDDDDDKDKQ